MRRDKNGKQINDGSFESTDFENVMADVWNERYRQDEKWGIQNHTPVEWLPILIEEVGEVAKEIFESNYAQIPSENYRTELIHVAAVAIAMIENFDRNNNQDEITDYNRMQKMDKYKDEWDELRKAGSKMTFGNFCRMKEREG